MASQSRTERENALRESYSDLTVDQCKEEVVRLSRIKMDQVENKKAEMRAYAELIKETQEKIEFLVGRVDYLAHEAQVAELEAAG